MFRLARFDPPLRVLGWHWKDSESEVILQYARIPRDSAGSLACILPISGQFLFLLREGLLSHGFFEKEQERRVDRHQSHRLQLVWVALVGRVLEFLSSDYVGPYCSVSPQFECRILDLAVCLI